MSKKMRLIGTLMAIVTSIGMALGISATPASAATWSCAGDTYGCVGHDPAISGCPVSSTVTAYAYQGSTLLATLWNRYSITCNANWTRAQLTPAAVSAGDTLYTYIDTTDNRGVFEFDCAPVIPSENNVGDTIESCRQTFPDNGYGGSSIIYSDMVNGTNVTFAHVIVIDPRGNTAATADATQ